MPLDKGKLQKLYSTLQQGGYSQSYDEFEKGFTGNDNYPNRKKVYDLLTEHGADIGKTYEDFMGKMQAPAQPSQPQQRTQAPAPAPKPQPKPAPKPKPRPKPKAKGGGMTAAQRAAFIKSAQDIVHHSAAGLQRVKNQMDYANGNRGLKVRPVHLGQNSKVVRRHANGTVANPRPVFDVAPEQQPGDTYLTESGNEYVNRAEADTEQNAVDQYRYDQSETGQLNNAYAEAERLDKLLEQRGKELDAENQDKWWRDLPRGGGGAVSTMNANDNNGRMTDTEYLNLLAARKKVDEQIRDLKAARDEKTGTFLGGLWRGFRDYAFDLSNWDNGYRDLLTTSAMLRAKTGAAQTQREKAAERMMMEDTYKAGVAAQKAEEALGNGYSWGRITAQALPYGLQFMAGNAIGVTGGLARAGEGMGVKLARKIAIKEGANNMIRNFGRSVLKNTGVMLGDLGAATALSTTVQAAQTGADIGHRYAGDVVYDPKTDDYKLEGGKSLGRSIYEGVANSTIENYTEMLGEHMHLGKFASSALSKIGLGGASKWFTKVGKTDFMKGVNKYLGMAGFNGYPQEVMEEEVGIPLHAIFDGGNKMSDLLDGRQQLDIVGGMLFSMAGMGGASMAMQGGHKAAMAVQYHQDQHKLDNADKIASFRLTSDKWAPIKDEIDGTTNEDFGKTMKNVLSNDELSDQEKQAVWDYAQRLIIMRGHNMGQEAATRNGMTDKETNTANESYTQGYNTTDATAMNDAKNRLAAAQQKLDGIFGENTNAQQILDAKKEDGSPYFTANDRKAAQAVVNAQQEYEGMMQRVRDDIDDEVQQTGAIYDSRTNDQGVIQSATLKAQNPDGTDKKVYITSGNVVMTDDGKSVDNQKSDMSIVVVDEDGKVQMISPDEIFSLDAPLDGEQAKQQAIDAIKQSKAQEAADKINGKVDYTAGNTYTITDSKGQQIEATLVANQQTGAVENPDGSVNVSMGGKVVPMAKDTFQQMVDATNMQRSAQGDEEAAATQQPTEGADAAAAQQQPTEQADENGNDTATEEGSGVVPTYPGSVVAPSEPHQWQMDDTFVIDNGGVPVRGQVTGIDADGVEIYTESPINGKKMQVISPEELQSKVSEINGEAVGVAQEDAAAQQQPTEQSGQSQLVSQGTEQSGVNGEQAQEQAPQTQEQARPQQTEEAQGQQSEESQQPQSALDRIPSDEVTDKTGNTRTVHHWEQAEPGDTYDALSEIYHGNADRVKKGVQNRISSIDKQIKATQKQMDAIDNSDDFDAVAAQGEKYDQLQQQKAALEQQKKYWQGVQNVPVSRRAERDKRTEEEKAAAKAERAKAEAEALEKARQERERVNGVPDVINDTPSDARQRGFRNVNGMVVNRQGDTEGITGRDISVKFSSKDTAKGHIKVIDADQLQPSHVSGQRNPSFFIDEAQPKDRTDTVSSMAAAKIASNLNPEEITGDGSAYQFSAPTVNSRGEVIQGNNRSDALKLMYSNPAFKPAQDAYKQYISDHAEEFGFTPEDVAKIQQMQHPVMVNELGVDDDEAIRLGQMKASDNESGGIERIDPVTTSQKLGAKVGSYANILLSSPDEDASLSDVLMQNGAKTVHWLSSNGIISNTAAQSAFDRKGNLTPEARMDLLNILKQSLFQGGVSDLPAMFDKMPAKAQKAILNTFMRDFDSAESERILPEIQKAIEAWYGCAMSNEAFAKAPNYKSAKAAMHDWTLQTNLLDDNMPSDKFSNFAMELACRLQGCSMRETQQSLNDFFDLVQGKSQGDLFGGTTLGEQEDRQEAIKRIFNIEYKPIKNKNNGKNGSNAVADDNSQSGEGRPGSTGDGADRERAAGAEQHADVAGGTEGNDEKGINAGAIRTKDGGYKKLPTGYAYRITDAQEVKDVIENGMFRKMPDDMIVPGSNKVYTSKSGRKFSFGKQAGNTHGGKAFAAGMPWGDNGNGGTTSGGSGEKYFIAIPGNNIDGWRVGHHGHYSEPRPFDEIEEGKGLWLPFDEDGDVADLSTDGMRVFKKVGDTYYEVEHPEDIANNATQQTSQPIGSTSSPEHVKTEREAVNTEPTEKQKEAGNYKKGHIKVDGFDITIENPKGSTRSGTDASGKAWSVPMHYDYGYIKGTEGVDGDHIDVYLSDDPTQGNVYVVDQVNQDDGTFDEHKVMYGFPSMEAAIAAYKGQYTDGWKVGTVTEVSREDFKKWVESSKRKTKPFSEYKSVKEAAAQQPPERSGQPRLVSRGTEHEALPTLKDPTVYKNNLAGGDAYVNIEGNPNSGYEVRYYNNKQDADINYPLAIVTEYMTAEQLADHLHNGDFTIAEQPTEPSTPTGTNGVNGSHGVNGDKGKEKHGKTKQKAETKEQEPKAEPKKNAGQFGLVSDERMEELKKRLRAKLNNLNMGVDPEVLVIGLELTAGYIDRGVKKFADYSKAMINDLGDVVRPYLKAFYNGVRDMPEITGNGLDKEMDDYDTVSKFNVATIGKEGDDVHPSILDTAEQVSNESHVEKEAQKVPDDDVKKEREKGKMEMHEVDTDRLFKDLKAGKTATLSDYYKDKGVGEGFDLAIDEAHDRFLSQLYTFKEKPTREMLEAALKDRDKWIDELAAIFKSGKSDGIVNGKHVKNVDVLESMANMLGQRKALQEQLDKVTKAADAAQQRPTERSGHSEDSNHSDDSHVEAAHENAPKKKEEEKDASQEKHPVRYGSRGYTLRPATQADFEGNAPFYVDGKQVHAVMLVRTGEQVSATQFSAPRVEAIYTTTNERIPVEKLEVEDVPKTVHLKSAGNFYEAYGNDAVALGRATGVTITQSNGGQKMAGFPKDYLDKVEQNLRDAGYDISVDDKATKAATDNIIKQLKGAPTAKTATSAIKNAMSGKKTEGKKNNEKKKVVSSQQKQQEPSLFDELFNDNSTNQKQAEDGLQRNDELRPEGLPSDSDHPGEHSERQGQGTSQGREGSDRERKGTGVRGVLGSNEQPVRPGERLNQHNNHAERGKDYAPTGVDDRIEANIAAIEMMHKITDEGRQATPSEMKVLRRFSGWGGLGKAFKEPEWGARNPYYNRLKALLSDEEWQEAEMSRNSAYFTPATVIDNLWDIARALGFKGGNVLEGSAGIGNIIGLMPTDMSERSHIQAVEIDSTTGGILRLLYPDAKTDIQGFEQTKVRNGSVDLAITNVPFVTGLHVNDTTSDKDLSRKFGDIHDFCIAKNVRKLKPGGIGIFITSSGTMDKSQKLRDWLVNDGDADVIGAFRMNNETFGGTSATSDIIVVRKRVDGKKSPMAIDVSKVGVERMGTYHDRLDGDKELPVDYNQYFIDHPENMGGKMYLAGEKGDTYRPSSKSLYPVGNISQKKRMEAWVKSLGDMYASAQQQAVEQGEDAASAQNLTDDAQESTVYDTLGDDVKEGSMLVDKQGRLCVATYGEAVPLAVNSNKVKGHTKVECFNAYKRIKDAVKNVLDYQTQHDDNKGLQPLLAELNQAYDTFVNTYGHLNKNTAISFLKNDMDFSGTAALEGFEEYNDKNGKRLVKYTKSDIFSQRVVEKESEPHPTTVKDGVITSIYKNGRIDLGYIAGELGKSREEVKQSILDEGLGFEDPVSGETVVSYEYLSGNVREKLHQAEAQNEGGRYDANIKALQKVIPMNIPSHLIEYSLGSSWLDPELYEQYIEEKTGIKVKARNIDGTWAVSVPSYGLNNEKNRMLGVTSSLVGKTVFGHELIIAAMKNTSIVVQKTEKSYDGHTETITDKEATRLCGEKIDEIRQDFKDWARGKMQQDPDLSKKYEERYNDQFNNYVPKEIPDSFVPMYFSGATHKIVLRPHQAKAAIRGTTQNVLLAHEVGSGKTFTLISTAMEMRRLGTARKPMVVVQNATVGQFVSSAKFLYPNAKILTIESKDRNAEGRKAFYAKIKYNDWDMVVIPQSVLDMIPDSEERQLAFVQAKIAEKEQALRQMAEADVDDPIMMRRAQKELETLQEEMNTLSEQVAEKKKDSKKAAVARQNAKVRAEQMLDRKVDDVANFDDMGIDALLVDEAHEYKHLGFATAMQRGVKGVDPSYSKKCQGLYLKCQSVMEKTGGKNIIFATGTPISNTAAEIWTFMKYLMPEDMMKDYGIYYFDDFVRNFGDISQIPEFNTAGKFVQNNRFKGYQNLPELVRIWSGVSDTVLSSEIADLQAKIPQMQGGKAQDIYLPQTRALRSIMKYVRAQLKDYENMSGKEKKEHSALPLMMYGIAKAAAVDPRLVQSDAEDDEHSKTNACVKETLKALDESKKYQGTVAIFADNYQNKHSGFNLFDDIKEKLVKSGVPEKQIVVIKPGMTVEKKTAIFDKVNAGEVRVVLGTTATLGTGVNMQERLYTLIHLDAPNRPMDYTQRNGRILRQGNLHKEWNIPVKVIRFGVEDSLDVTAYQRLKTKGAIADSIMHGKDLMSNSMENRTIEEEEDQFGDTVAQLSGSEYALLKQQAERELRKYEGKKKQWEADQVYIHSQKPRLEGQIEAAKKRSRESANALDALSKSKEKGIVVGKKHFAGVDAMGDFIKDFNKKVKASEDDIRSHKSESADHVLDVTVDGHTFKVRLHLYKDMGESRGNLFEVVKRRMTYSCAELSLSDIPVKGSLLRNALEDIEQNVVTGNDFRDRKERAEAEADRLTKELTMIKSREGKQFEYGEQLEAAKQKVDEYTKKMKAELDEKEKKYAEMDKEIGTSNLDEQSQDDDVLYRIEDDAEELDRLDKEPKVKVYRAMQLIDGKLYPPMAAKVNGSLVEPAEPGQWLRADEHPELAKNGLFTLNKGGKDASGKRLGSVPAAYNPYWHTSRSPLNDQFSSAYKRPNLVTVEVEIPKSELTSGYHADGAKNPVGEMSWHAGPVSSKLPKEKERKVILSRWCKVVRVVPDAEVADKVAGMLKGENISVPDNTVTPSLRRELEKRGVPITHTKMVEDWERKYPSTQSGLSREGNGAYSDDELSMINDPFVKMLGEKARTAKQRKALAARERRSMAAAVKDLAEKLHLDNVEIRSAAAQQPLTERATEQERRKARAKGYYDRKSGTIVINIDNHRDVEDAVQTLLHEAVAHYGLRQLFGSHFDTFLDNVYKAADMDVRQRITDLALRKYKGDFHVATEEYLASLAENTNFEHMPDSFWSKIKTLFLKMLHSIGFDGFAGMGVTLSDNELRYILWRSYENLKEPGRYRSILGEAEDVAKQAELKVGNYGENTAEQEGISAAQHQPTERSLDGQEEAAERETREEKLRRLTQRYVRTFKQWLKVRREYDRASIEDPASERTETLGTVLNGWNDNMDTLVDDAYDLGLDARQLRQLLNDNGIEDDDLREYDGMFGESVSEPEAWGKNDLLSKAEQVSHGMDPGLLFRDTIEDDDYTARDTYNRMADEKKNVVREAWQDSMINVRNLQDAVLKQRGEKMEDWEDAYNEENRSHGKSRAESEYFTDNLYKPLLKAVNAVAKAAKVSVGDVTEYMMAKHGLERNIVFASRDAQKAYDKAMQKAKGEYDALMNAAQAESDPKKKDALEKRAQKVKFPDYNDLYLRFRQRDYSGLTALTGQSDAQDAEVEAQRIVTDMESKAAVNGSAQNGLIDELWKATNAATEWTLRKAYDSGMMSRDNYDYVRSMFNNYIPLRGWEEDTAGDLYDYVGSGDKGTAFSPTLHKAKGRRSQADNPIAYIGSMAVSAIVQGNKNKVKQTFMRFAENHPTNLVTVSEMWYRNYGTDTAPDWREDVPYIPEDATADEIAAIVKQHEDDMEQLEAQGMATKQRGRLHLGVPVKKGQALEHHVEVMVNGKKYVLYINGNPRAAQALNGTRMRRSSERSFESSKIATIGRKLSERYTSLSPSFTVSNMFRDLTMAAISTAIKESPAYALRFRLNVARLGGPARMFPLMRWYRKAVAEQLPTGQMSGIKRYFYEFMTQGAETGFTSLKEIDTYKDDMQKMYKHMNQSLANPKRLLRGLSEGLEYTNRCIEDMTRFATYMTSRQRGRSVRESVSDAKTITLNFNRKGSGELGNSTYRNLQIFVNPAIQSLQNVASMAMDHPVKFSLYTGMVALIGAAQVFATQLLWSMFGGGDGDDDNWNAVDEYWKLPTWQRRNNLVMWIPGTKKFAMIPLAQEFRVFHGFGETLTTTIQGKSDENPALELMSQTADLLPLDFAGNNGNMLVNLAPTVVQPLLQVGFNTDFTGRPLYKDTGFNKYEPSFQKAYVGTPSWLVKSSEILNDLTGGDAHKQGWWERTKVGQYANNPAVVDHLLKGYYGGMYSFLAQTGGAMLTAASGKLPDVQEVPVANRVVTAVRETEQSGKQKLPDWYYNLSEENARHQNEFSGYKKDYMTGDADGKKKFNALIKSKDFAKWQEVNTYIGAVQQIRTAMSYTKDPAEKAELQKNLDEVLAELRKLKDK